MTPIIRYERKNQKVTGLGMMHIGSADYYRRMQQELDTLPYGLFEGVKPPLDEGNILPEKRKHVQEMNELGKAYERIAQALNVTTQKASISYPAAWSNPDIHLDELVNASSSKLMKSLKTVRMVGLFVSVFYEADPGYTTDKLKWAFRNLMGLSAWTSIIPAMGVGADMHKMLLEKRNRLVYAAADGLLDGPGAKEELGIMYGSAHFKGIHRYLRQEGFKEVHREWVPVMDVRSETTLWSLIKEIYFSKDGDDENT